MPLSVVIADDEPLARERLRVLLANQPDTQVVAEVGDGPSTRQAVAEFRPDVVLLDISMPGEEGLETARKLAALNPRPAVVFCTAYDAHALSAFEAEAIDYLLKPVRPERLASALVRARTFLTGRIMAAEQSQTRTHLCARLRGNIRLIPLDEIYYLQAEDKYVMVHHAHGEDLIEESLKSLEEEFSSRFIRIHRNCLVSNHELVELRRTEDGRMHAILRNTPTHLEVSRRCVAALRNKVKML